MKLGVKYKSIDIISSFTDFFHRNNHKLLPPSALLSPVYDSTLFTIAGMKQFINYFLGKEKPEFRKVITIQPCLRVNDLDLIGISRFHHTFFEMLGMFSFNDYFKKEAIHFIHDFLFKELGIPKDYIYITVHSQDQEAHDIWKELIDENRIVYSSNNIWKSGAIGPCGYCSEIFFSRSRELMEKQHVVDAIDNSDPSFLEIGNIVFIAYNCESNGEWKELDQKSIDTGLGLERVCSVMKIIHEMSEGPESKEIGSLDTYSTDLFIVNNNDLLLADHGRAILFLCSEDLKPSSEGQGYVLRKMLRRLFIYYDLQTVFQKIKAYFP